MDIQLQGKRWKASRILLWYIANNGPEVFQLLAKQFKKLRSIFQITKAQYKLNKSDTN